MRSWSQDGASEIEIKVASEAGVVVSANVEADGSEIEPGAETIKLGSKTAHGAEVT